MLNPKKALVIEDNPVYAKIIEKRLASDGIIVVHAQDGLVGFNLARKIRPDIIILDIMLPSLDGYKVCHLLKFDKTFKDIPIVILTSRDTDVDAELAEYARADAFLVKKTVNSTIMMDVVHKLIETTGKYDVEEVMFEGETLDVLKCKTVTANTIT
jgi:DNA-binding response OmpR family regulator